MTDSKDTLIDKTLRTGIKGALVNLVELKRHKDAFGADDFYKSNKDRVWEIARQAIDDDQSGEMLGNEADLTKAVRDKMHEYGQENQKSGYCYSAMECAVIAMQVLRPYLREPKREYVDIDRSAIAKHVMIAKQMLDHGDYSTPWNKAVTIMNTVFESLNIPITKIEVQEGKNGD